MADSNDGAYFRFRPLLNTPLYDFLYFTQLFPGDDGSWETRAAWRSRMVREILADLRSEPAATEQYGRYQMEVYRPFGDLQPNA